MANLTKHFFEDGESKGSVRINKYLSEAGMCSRRAADQLIEDGKVLIDGIPAVKGSKVMPGQQVTLQGQQVKKEEKLVLIAFNKPKGIVCTAEKREPDNIIDFLQFDSRIFPIGRLDRDSEGLILLTNDGEIMNKILRTGNQHEREYLVQVNKPVTKEFLEGMAGGVPILDTVTKPCLIENLERDTFRIVLRQGLNRQIRRMCEYFGYRVLALKRIRIMNIHLGRLKTGGYRNLTDWELDELKQMLQESTNKPYKEMEGEIEELQGNAIYHDNSARRRPKKLPENPSKEKNGEEKGKNGINHKGKNAQFQKQDERNKNYYTYPENRNKYHAHEVDRKECNVSVGKKKEYDASAGKKKEYDASVGNKKEYHEPMENGKGYSISSRNNTPSRNNSSSRNNISFRNKEEKRYQDWKGNNPKVDYYGRSRDKNGGKKTKNQRTY